MPYDITDPAAVHRLQLEGREKLTVAGVEDVERFDDQCIVLRTGAGTLVVSGEDCISASCRWTAASCMWTGASTP